MSEFTYVVVKETPGYHIDSYSDTEDVEYCDTPAAAMALRDSLRIKAGDGEWYYVEVR